MQDLRCRGLALLFVVALFPAAASAQSAEKAEQSWMRGQKLFQQKNYQGALDEFADGYELTHKGGFLYNMAECARMMDNKEYARDLYQNYLDEFPTGNYVLLAKTLCDDLGLGTCRAPKAKPTSAPTAPKTAQTTQTVATATKAQVKESRAKQPASAPYLLPSAAAPSPPAARKPFYKHWGLWAGVLGAAVVAGTIAVLAVTLGGDDSYTPTSDLTVDFR